MLVPATHLLTLQTIFLPYWKKLPQEEKVAKKRGLEVGLKDARSKCRELLNF